MSRRRRWHPTCLENPTNGGAWKSAVHGVAEGWTRLSDFTFTFHFHALEKEMATHSSVLACRIPGMGEPGGLWSMGSQSRTRLKGLSSSSLFYLQMEMMFPNQFSELISDPYHFKNWENFHQMQLWKKESYGCFLGAES